MIRAPAKRLPALKRGLETAAHPPPDMGMAAMMGRAARKPRAEGDVSTPLHHCYSRWDRWSEIHQIYAVHLTCAGPDGPVARLMSSPKRSSVEGCPLSGGHGVRARLLPAGPH